MAAIIPYIPMIASAASSLISSNSNASGATEQASYQDSKFQTNAGIADAQSADAIARGDRNALAQDRKVKLLIGTQRAKLGAQGADLSSGSALDVTSDTAGLGAEDVLQIKNNAFREAWGYSTQAQDYRAQASLVKTGGQNVARNSILTGIVDAVGTGFAAYSKTKANTKTES